MNDSVHIISVNGQSSEPNTELQRPDFQALPIIAPLNLVLFPDVPIPISLVKENTIKVARYAMEHHIPVGICCQRATQPLPGNITDIKEVFTYGVVADVMQIIQFPGDDEHTVNALFKARPGRFKIKRQVEHSAIPDSLLNAEVVGIKDVPPPADDVEFRVMVESMARMLNEINKKSDDKARVLLPFQPEEIRDPENFINVIATHLEVPLPAKFDMLAERFIKKRGFMLFTQIQLLMSNADILEELRQRAKMELGSQNRNAFLQQQMNAIREELYGSEDDEIAELRSRLSTTPLPEPAFKAIEKEINKLEHLNPTMPDYSVAQQYIDTVLSLPWGVYTENNKDFSSAEEILEADHYGLEKVKERILEQIALLMSNPGGRAPILCLVGAPGVGKTSLGQSVARALNRKYQRVSLGGLHDEAEIRGHRRTYIGAMPGRIIDAVRRAGSLNPVILLDEVDKIGADFKGDPSAALLEVLDPEQNCRFHDNYIDLDFDLSKVLFIATANTLGTLSQPLLDRMEIIDIPGYLVEEKMEIARRHLLPRIAKEHNLDNIPLPDLTLKTIIEEYTAESGVRQLEKALAKIARKIVLRNLKGNPIKEDIGCGDLHDLLGMPIHHSDRYEGNEYPGVVTGLAWTAAGGEILFVETSLAKAKEGGKLTLTGNLGDVMKESATIALQYARAHAEELGIDPEMFATHSIHLHVPEGAIPKDGPSAGITMATSIVSALTGRRVRERLAMTGELTLRGKILPVGGIKEKILAAKRAGITTIMLSEDNRRDIDDINPRYIEGLDFHYVATMADALAFALI